MKLQLTNNTPQKPATNPKYRPDIDGLRAIAVLSVVIFHTFPVRLPGGFVGVDVFFVISGFLISSIIFNSLDKGQFSFAGFYARRIRRIYPALILVLVTSFVFAWFALLADEFKQLGKHLLAGSLFLSNFSLLSEAGYFDMSAETKPMLHLWSLAIEEQFYIVWPLFAWFCWKRKLNTTLLIAILWLGSFYLNITTIQQDSTYTFFSPLTRFWELLTGCLLAIVLQKQSAGQKYSTVGANALSILGLGLLVYALFGIHKAFMFPGYWAMLPVAGAVCMIAAGADAWVNKRLLANPLMVWFGLISFPLYLWHWPIISFLWILESGRPSRLLTLAAIGASILLAWLTYRYVEKNIRHSNKPMVVPLLVAAMAVIGIVGGIVYTQDGLPNRKALASVAGADLPPIAFEADNPIAHARCLALYQLSDKVRFCSNSTNNKAQIALIGDSHAKAMYEGFTQTVATQPNAANSDIANLGVANLGGRLFVDIATYPDGNAAEIDTYIGGIEATKKAAATPEMQYVVMFSRGPAYFNPAINFKLISDPSVTDREKVWEIGMRKTLALFSQKKSVVFVIDNPDIDFNPRTCVAGRPLRISAFRQDCSIAKADYLKTSQRYRDLVFKVLKDYPNVKVFDIAAQLCDDSRCWAKKDGQVLYLDDNHLSLAGAKLVSKDLLTLLLSDKN